MCEPYAFRTLPRFALIQDGTETVRQRFADVLACFERCAEELSDDRFTRFEFDVFTDERVGPLLESVDPADWGCLVFASNALLSGEVDDAVGRHRDSLHRYLAAGGGLVVFHQQRDSLAPLLPDELLPTMHERGSPRRSTTTAPAEGSERDVLLHFPHAVDWRVLRDVSEREDAALRAAGQAMELPSLFFKAFDRATLPAGLKPVLLSSADETVICRSQDHVAGRVVLSTAPLDWQGSRPGGQGPATRLLLANAIRFACTGPPRRLIWYRAEKTSNELLLRWLTLDGAAALEPAPRSPSALDVTDRWLLEVVDAFVFPAALLPAVEHEPVVLRFLQRGGAAIAVQVDPGAPATRVVALVGRYEERTLASQLFAELRAVADWQQADYAFELRNILAALSFLHADEHHRTNPAATDPASLGALGEELERRLCDPIHQEDLGSSIALAQCLAFVYTQDEPVPATAIDWLEREVPLRPFDVALQIRAAITLGRRRLDTTFLADVRAQLEAQGDAELSMATIVRVLEAIAVLDQAGLLAVDDDATAVALVAADRLDVAPQLRFGGWSSTEATASVVLGLVALYDRIEQRTPELAARLAAHVATAAAALRRSLRRYRPNPKGVAWLARIVQALIATNRHFPIGMQRLSALDWPEREAARAGERSSQALIEELAVRNEHLRRACQESETTRTDLERRLAEHALPSRVGRATATLAPVVLLATAFVVVVIRIGWNSLPGVLANVAVLLGVLLTMLGWVFGLLERWNLLAAPATRVREWLEEQGAPVIERISKLKRG